MKTTPMLLMFAAANALFCVRAFSAAAPQTSSTEPSATHESVALKVLKVFSAKDGENVFRAYMVEWNGQEVVVDDTLAKTNYHTDDTIMVLVIKSPFPHGRESYGLLHFTILPPMPGVR